MKLNMKSPKSFYIVIAMAIIFSVVLIKSKPDIEHGAQDMPSVIAEVITVKSIPYRVHIVGYGNVEPAISLNSMAELSGRIDYVHPNLKPGETISVGTVVVKINAKDYAVTLQQSEADLVAIRSALKQLGEEEKTTFRRMELIKKNLAVSKEEFSRILGMYDKKVVSKSTLDAEEQKVLVQRQQLEEIQGNINMFESRKQSLQAQIVHAEREVENRQTILSRTEITLPFDARIGQVNVEKNEFVSVGGALFEAIDLQGIEITAQIPMSSMRKLVNTLRSEDHTTKLLEPGGRITDQLKLKAKVSLVNDLGNISWEAKVLRISDAIDATRQTLGIVVGVQKPYEKAIPGKRPPLIKGMYATVDIYGQPYEAVIIPRKAVHQGRVYLVNSENRLEIRQIDIQQIQGELVIIEAGLKEGDRVIVTDIFPVVEFMPVKAIQSEAMAQKMKQLANGLTHGEQR